MRVSGIALGLSALALAGCIEGTRGYSGPDSVIATNTDRGDDAGVLTTARPAIAYTPDGCQVWYIDDGVEGYASPRFDPVSGKPICNDAYPPGTVVGDYQSGTEGIRDKVPGSSGQPTIIPTE